jgi:hypothetical protein
MVALGVVGGAASAPARPLSALSVAGAGERVLAAPGRSIQPVRWQSPVRPADGALQPEGTAQRAASPRPDPEELRAAIQEHARRLGGPLSGQSNGPGALPSPRNEKAFTAIKEWHTQFPQSGLSAQRAVPPAQEEMAEALKERLKQVPTRVDPAGAPAAPLPGTEQAIAAVRDRLGELAKQGAFNGSLRTATSTRLVGKPIVPTAAVPVLPDRLFGERPGSASRVGAPIPEPPAASQGAFFRTGLGAVPPSAPQKTPLGTQVTASEAARRKDATAPNPPSSRTLPPRGAQPAAPAAAGHSK